jgi:hypothetical protein
MANFDPLAATPASFRTSGTPTRPPINSELTRSLMRA